MRLSEAVGCGYEDGPSIGYRGLNDKQNFPRLVYRNNQHSIAGTDIWLIPLTPAQCHPAVAMKLHLVLIQQLLGNFLINIGCKRFNHTLVMG